MELHNPNKKVTIRDRHDNKAEVLASELVYRPAVYGILLQDDHVLLLPQWDGYDFPGGGIDLGETIEEALKREAKEETGLDTEATKLLDAQTEFFVSLDGKRKYHSILLYYFCRDFSGELSDEGFDDFEKTYARLAEWVPISKTSDIKFCNGVDSIALIQQAQKIYKST